MRLEENNVTGTSDPVTARGSFLEVLGVFSRLGLTSFGGPIAHLGYFRQEIVVRRKWLDEASYADLIALCQFLPGPSSSQTGIALGISRAGLWGGLAAWLGFTLPSAILLTLFAYATSFLHGATTTGLLNGLLVVAVAVVAQAVWGMATTLCPDRPRATMAIVSAIAILLWPIAIVQITIIVLAGLIGWRLLRKTQQEAPISLPITISRRLAISCWIVFFPRGFPGLWWRSCRPAAVATRGGSRRMGNERSVHNWLRRRPGSPWSTFYLLGLSWCRQQTSSQWVARSVDCPCCHLFALVLFRDRHPPVLECITHESIFPGSATRCECCGSGNLTGCALSTHLDQRDPRTH